MKRKLGRPPDLGKRDAILTAASEAFLANGYSGAAIERIAAAAGVSKLTIYKAYGGKSGLFLAAIERECERLRSVFSIDDVNTAMLRDRLVLVGYAMVGFWSRPQIVQFERRIAAETEHNPSIGLSFLEAGPRHLMATLVEYFEELAKGNDLSIYDASVAAEQFASLCGGFGDFELRFGAPPSDIAVRQRVESAADFFLKVYGRPDPLGSSGNETAPVP